MKKFSILFFSIVFLSSLAVTAKNNNLSNKIEISKGAFLALFLNGVVEKFMDLAEDWKAPVIFTFKKKEGFINVNIFGSRGNIDGAKESLSEFRTKIFNPMLELLKVVHNIELDVREYSISYTNWKRRKILIQFVAGKYFVP